MITYADCAGGLGYLKFLAPPDWALRWIEGKLNLLGRLPHYVSVDQKTYGRYGVLPTTNATLPPPGDGNIALSYIGSSQRLGPWRVKGKRSRDVYSTCTKSWHDSALRGLCKVLLSGTLVIIDWCDHEFLRDHQYNICYNTFLLYKLWFRPIHVPLKSEFSRVGCK